MPAGQANDHQVRCILETALIRIKQGKQLSEDLRRLAGELATLQKLDKKRGNCEKTFLLGDNILVLKRGGNGHWNLSVKTVETIGG